MIKNPRPGYFEANGQSIHEFEDGTLALGNAPAYKTSLVSKNAAKGLEEYFRFKRDKELGRTGWRSKRHPEFFTVENTESNWIKFFYETAEHIVYEFTRDPSDTTTPTWATDTAREVYEDWQEDHPEAAKPWLNAKDGELWMIAPEPLAAPFKAIAYKIDDLIYFRDITCGLQYKPTSIEHAERIEK